MLQQVLEYIHNYFIEAPNPGTYTIADGMVSPLPPLKNGQRFWICGSSLNDGVYTYRDGEILNDDGSDAVGLQDETFAGTMCALAVPPAVITLSGEIASWVESNRAAMDSPYTSESFNGYSYSKRTGGKTGGNGALTWRDAPQARDLERWRKPCL